MFRLFIALFIIVPCMLSSVAMSEQPNIVWISCEDISRILAAMATLTPLHPTWTNSPKKEHAIPMLLQRPGFARHVVRQSLQGCIKIVLAHITCVVMQHFHHG